MAEDLYRERSARHTRLQAEREQAKAALARLNGSEDVAVVGALLVREMALGRLVPAAYDAWRATPDPQEVALAERHRVAEEARVERRHRGAAILRVGALD